MTSERHCNQCIHYKVCWVFNGSKISSAVGDLVDAVRIAFLDFRFRPQAFYEDINAVIGKHIGELCKDFQHAEEDIDPSEELLKTLNEEAQP